MSFTIKLSRQGRRYFANVFRDGEKIFRSPGKIEDVADEAKMKEWFVALIESFKRAEQEKYKDENGEYKRRHLVGGADAFLGQVYTETDLGI